MAVNSRSRRPYQRSSRGAGNSIQAIHPVFVFLALLLLLAGPVAAQAGSGSGMKGPSARSLSVAMVDSDTADNSSSLQLLLGGIRFFQKWVSPIDGPRCNFTPTCSHFGFQAVQTQGVLLGVVLTADRLMRCHYSIEPNAGYVRLPGGSLHDPVIHNLPPRPQ
jgi:hypothetical protein